MGWLRTISRLGAYATMLLLGADVLDGHYSAVESLCRLLLLELAAQIRQTAVIDLAHENLREIVYRHREDRRAQEIRISRMCGALRSTMRRRTTTCMSSENFWSEGP